MKKVVVLGLGLVLAVAGCATKPGYVGNWECNALPQEATELGMQSLSLSILEQGGFIISSEDTTGETAGGVGRWISNEDGSGQLLDDGTLMILGTSGVAKFDRKE